MFMQPANVEKNICVFTNESINEIRKYRKSSSFKENKKAQHPTLLSSSLWSWKSLTLWQQLLIQNDYNDVDECKEGNKQKNGKRANYRVKYIQIDRQTCRQTDRNIYTDIESDRVLITPYNTNNNTNNTITCQTNFSGATGRT